MTNVTDSTSYTSLLIVRLAFLCCVVQLAPAPPPPPFPEGYVSQEALGEKEELGTQGGESQPPQVDPIIDQGPAKRMKF